MFTLICSLTDHAWYLRLRLLSTYSVSGLNQRSTRIAFTFEHRRPSIVATYSFRCTKCAGGYQIYPIHGIRNFHTCAFIKFALLLSTMATVGWQGPIVCSRMACDRSYRGSASAYLPCNVSELVTSSTCLSHRSNGPTTARHGQNRISINNVR